MIRVQFLKGYIRNIIEYKIGLISLNKEIWMNSLRELLFEERSLDL